MSLSRNFLSVAPLGSKLAQVSLLSPCVQSKISDDRVRGMVGNRHWNPKWKKYRTAKYMKIELPDFNEKESDLNETERKDKMRKLGLKPPRPWVERPLFLSCTGAIFETYVPPEGDGKMSFVSVGGTKQNLQFLEKKSRSMLAVRKIRSYDEEFEVNTFGKHAQDIYVKAHELLCDMKKEDLRDCVTERCYPELLHNAESKTIHWKFIKSLEPPRIVHARTTTMITKENLFAQVTVRFHTQQQLAIYDRFGRLMHGSEILAKDVLEYVVFEKHLSNIYGIWRIHDKIIPKWMPEKDPSPRTHNLSEHVYNLNYKIEPTPEEKPKEEKSVEKTPPPQDGPQLATA